MDWVTERRATHLAETSCRIVTSSGWRWWVSKAVSCHRNSTRAQTAQEVERCYFTSAPLRLCHAQWPVMWNKRISARPTGDRPRAPGPLLLHSVTFKENVSKRSEWLHGNPPGCSNTTATLKILLDVYNSRLSSCTYSSFFFTTIVTCLVLNKCSPHSNCQLLTPYIALKFSRIGCVMAWYVPCTNENSRSQQHDSKNIYDLMD